MKIPLKTETSAHASVLGRMFAAHPDDIVFASYRIPLPLSRIDDAALLGKLLKRFLDYLEDGELVSVVVLLFHFDLPFDL